MPALSPDQPSYAVQLVQCPGLAPDQRAAIELQFRVALELALGGAEQVLLALQAYRLAQALQDDLEEDIDDELETVENEADGQSLIKLWEKAESDAISAAIKPLSADVREQIAEARFEIMPH